MSVYTIDKCERFVSQRAGCGKAARPEFCEGCTTVRGAPTRPIKGTVRKRVCGDVKVLHTFFLCVEHI